jgi:hypothetical protein
VHKPCMPIHELNYILSTYTLVELMRYDVFIAMDIIGFWVVTQFSLLERYHCFGGNCCLSYPENEYSRFLQNIYLLFTRLYNVIPSQGYQENRPSQQLFKAFIVFIYLKVWQHFQHVILKNEVIACTSRYLAITFK